MSIYIKVEGGVGYGSKGGYGELPVTWEVRPWGTAKHEHDGKVIIEGYTEDAERCIVDDFWTVMPKAEALRLARAIIEASEGDE